MKYLFSILLVAGVTYFTFHYFFGSNTEPEMTTAAVNTADDIAVESTENKQTIVPATVVRTRPLDTYEAETKPSPRTLYQSDEVELPLAGSAPTTNVTHSISIEEIRQGCFIQDCIQSVDNPEFISVTEAEALLPPDSIGIALTYKDEVRFYPFPMLETHELVNDVVAGDPLLVSYCPLCGTGIVFDRRLDGAAVEFGVSGMLWQSNLLMYNRAEAIEDRNLWSQVLGEAVVGNRAGQALQIVPSDIVRFSDWKVLHPEGLVLTTGSPRDPYGGNYYAVASNFAPNFSAADSPLDPSTYVYGITLEGVSKAYPRDMVPPGITTDVVNGQTVILERQGDTVSFTTETGTLIPDKEGFWFSWVSAYPETELWNNT